MSTIGLIQLCLICIVIQTTLALRCCNLIGNDHNECKQLCQQGSEEMDMRNQMDHLAELGQTCPHSLTTFWSCINNTYSVMNTASRWEGRNCCMRALSETCQIACQQGKSKAHVAGSCPPRSEQSFHQCLKKQESSVQCCNSAAVSQCRGICKAIFLQDSPLTPAQNNTLIQQCPVQITSCVHNYTKLSKPQDPAESLPCCEESENMACRNQCKTSLKTLKNEAQIMESLMEYCGIPMIMSQNDALWKCFLKTATNGLGDKPPNTPTGTIEMAGMDGAKLHCCQKAATTKCTELCFQTHGRSFSTSWKQFDNECVFSPSEVELNKCLDEVSEPCTLGCSGLDFCHNFNHRPTEMFRSCNKQAEKVAQITLEKWSEGIINLPFIDRIPVKSIETCRPEWWRVIACSLQIKPCHAKHPVTRICYHDCVRVLGECLDRTKVPSGVTHTTLCQKLAPVEGEEEHCIRLGNYLVDSPRKLESSEVSQPCTSSPCNNTQICTVSRSKCSYINKEKCPEYSCKHGCQLGEVSPVYAPYHSYVLLPLSSKINCHRMCECGRQGQLHKCQELGCRKQSDCHLGSGRIHAHNSKFKLDCNDCLCYNGEVMCTRHECFESNRHRVKGYTGLPCNCDTQYIPVCGQDGHTYWNPCLARCSRINDRQFQLEPCLSHDPCDNNNCNRNEECLPKRQKCLHSNHCKQYICVNTRKQCDQRVNDPVCDTDGIQYTNPCNMLKNGGNLNYWGRCQDGCDQNSGPVCGIDRETYPSECHAWAAKVLVDYYGDCRVTPALVGSRDDAQYQCEGVVCPEILTKEFCLPIKPVGACCHVCASEIRVLYSKNLIESMMNTELDIVYTIRDMAGTLTEQLSTAQCDVFAYISVEQDLVLLVSAITKDPTPVQVDACRIEADKLTALVDGRASAIQTPALTSPLLSASIKQPQTRTFPVVHSGVYSNSAVSYKLSFHMLIFLILLCQVQVYLSVNCLIRQSVFTYR